MPVAFFVLVALQYAQQTQSKLSEQEWNILLISVLIAVYVLERVQQM